MKYQHVFVVDAHIYHVGHGIDRWIGKPRPDRTSALRDAVRWMRSQMVEVIGARPDAEDRATRTRILGLCNSDPDAAIALWNEKFAPMLSQVDVERHTLRSTTRGDKLEQVAEAT